MRGPRALTGTSIKPLRLTCQALAKPGEQREDAIPQPTSTSGA